MRETDISQLAWDAIRLPHGQEQTRQVDLQLKFSPESHCLELYSATFGGPQHDRRLQQFLGDRLELPELRQLNLTIASRWGIRMGPAASDADGAPTGKGGGDGAPRQEKRYPPREPEALSERPEQPPDHELAPLEQGPQTAEEGETAGQETTLAEDEGVQQTFFC